MRLAALFLLLPLSVQAQDDPFVLAERDVARPSTSVAWVDYDGDGMLDLVFTDNRDANTLFLNQNGTLQRTTFGTSSGQVQDGAFADIDNDDDPDLVIGSLSQSALILNTDSGYLPVASILDSFYDVRGFDLFDVNNDGVLDAYLARRRGRPDILLLGDGQGGFVTQPSPAQTATDTNGLCVSDYDQDGDMDVFTIETSGFDNTLLRNEGGVLTPVPGHPAQLGTSTSVCEWGDADGDGDMDLFLASTNGVSRLYVNEAGTLTEASETAFPFRNLVAQAAAWADVDNDGDLDLVIAGRNSAARLLRTDDGGMTEIEILPDLTSDKWTTGAAMADYDRDGDLDLALSNGNSELNERNYVFDNVGANGNWIQVQLIGTASNRDGVGTWVEATATIGGETRTLVRERRIHNGRLSQGSPLVHFGLGDADAVSLTLQWPSGRIQTVGPLAVNTFYSIEEAGTVTTQPTPTREPLSLHVSPNPSLDAVTIHVTAAETGPVETDVFDLWGRRVWTDRRTAFAGAPVQIRWSPASSLAAGVYTVRVRQDAHVTVQRVTLVR